MKVVGRLILFVYFAHVQLTLVWPSKKTGSSAC